MTGGACRLLIGFNCSHTSANSWTLPPSAGGANPQRQLRDIPGIKSPPPPRINRGNAVQQTLWKSPHDDNRPQLFASEVQVVQFLSEAMKMMRYVHEYPRLSARGTPDHAYKFRKPGTSTSLHLLSLILLLGDHHQQQRCRRDMNNTPQRCRRIINITPQRQPLEYGRKPTGRSPCESAYRLSSRLLRSRPPSPAVISPSISVPIDRFIAAMIPTIISPSVSIIVSAWPIPASSRSSGIPCLRRPNGPPGGRTGNLRTPTSTRCMGVRHV